MSIFNVRLRVCVQNPLHEWPPKAMMTSPVLMGREEIIDDSEFKAAHRAHVLHRISEERIESKVAPGGMTREQVIDRFLGSYANSDLGHRLKAYHAEHGHYPEPFGFSKDIPSDAIGELKAKAWEMAEILFEHEGAYKVIPIQHFLPDLEQRVRDFYADHGQWPVFKRDPYGRGLTIGTQAEIDQLPPPPPPPPPRPPVSEEPRRILREDNYPPCSVSTDQVGACGGMDKTSRHYGRRRIHRERD